MFSRKLPIISTSDVLRRLELLAIVVATLLVAPDSFQVLTGWVRLVTELGPGPKVKVMSRVALALSCLVVLAVFVKKLLTVRKLVWQDTFLILATANFVAFTISIDIRINDNLTSSLTGLSKVGHESFEVSDYVPSVFLILGLFFAKVSTAALLMALAPTKAYKLPTLVAEATALLLTVYSLTVESRQRTTSSVTLIAADVFIESIFIISSINIIWRRQLNLTTKVVFISAFLLRVLPVGFAILRVPEAREMLRGSMFASFGDWMPIVATMLELFSSIFTASLLHLAPFLGSIQAAYMSGIIEEGKGVFLDAIDQYLQIPTRTSRVQAMELCQAQTSKVNEIYLTVEKR